MSELQEKYNSIIHELEKENEDLAAELKSLRKKLDEETEKRLYYQQVADFTHGWELWYKPDGSIHYCSPSCLDLTGYSLNQILASKSIPELLVFDADKEKFIRFISDSLKQNLHFQSLEFRLMTRNKQLKWCSMNIRGVYNRQGHYLGIRASVHDISRLKKAYRYIKDLTTEKDFENKAKNRIKSELEFKERELVSFLLQLANKNGLIQRALNGLTDLLETRPGDPFPKMDQIIHDLTDSSEKNLEWESVSQQLGMLFPGFLENLKLKYPKLSLNDHKLCAYLKLGLTSKEISDLIGITPKSVEIARVRLRKKLRLTREINLGKYLDKV
jgi:PAS domain S-box-containing protein